jgi:hypothetical protein
MKMDFKSNEVKGVRKLTPLIIVKNVAFGFAGGAIFGICFAGIAWLTKPGPALLTGIAETWWYFAFLGSIAQPIAYRFDSYEGLRNISENFLKSSS